MTRLGWGLAVVAAFVATPAAAQQPSVQIASAAQITTGDDSRLGGQHRVEPDLGVRLFDPASRFGSLQIEANLTRRQDRIVLGRGVLRLENVVLAGLTWSFGAGDVWTPPIVSDFSFANLFAPPVTFRGVSVSGRNKKTSVLATAGRVSAQRNIFGTDSLDVGQRLYQVSFTHRPISRFEVFAHGSRVSGSNLKLYTAVVDKSTDIGAGVRFQPGLNWQIATEAGYTRFQRHGSPMSEHAPSWLVGTSWTGVRGWFQLNAQRFSIGRYPVVNYPHLDRTGLFATGELDLGAGARVFAGGEVAKSNLNESASNQATTGIPPGSNARGFGGIRFRVTSQSLVSLRVEGGNRTIRPSRFGPGFDSDTGVITAEWHGSHGRASGFARYERRANVDAQNTDSSFTQHDASAQAYLSLAGNRQLFAQALFSRRADRNGAGQTLWQGGAGAQLPMKQLFLRFEATAGRTLDWASGLATNRIALSTGLSGQIARRTFLSIDSYVERSPFIGSTGSPWVTRTMVRLTKEFTYGTSRAPRLPGEPPRGGPTGKAHGFVFVDWNGNGMRDADEEPVGDVGVALGRELLRSGADGRFAFDAVPVGDWVVSLDAGTISADFDLPSDSQRQVGVVKGRTTVVEFALAPVGTIQGAVYNDVDGDGQLGPGDLPVGSAVLVLDDGTRSEAVRAGRFRFDSVRIGAHRLTLLQDSLPEDSQLVGSPTLEVVLSRDHTTAQVTYLVKIEKRPEIRKVFPPKKLE
jgi:hypothetical protein